jgi:hypothetical protein
LVAGGDHSPLTAGFLENERLFPPHRSSRRLQYDGSIRGDGNVVGAFDPQSDARRFRLGRDDEVVFQFMPFSVVDQVDAGVNRGVFHPAIVCDGSVPIRLHSDKVVCHPALLVHAGDLRSRVRARQRCAKDGIATIVPGNL